MAKNRIISAAWMLLLTAPAWTVGCAKFTVFQYPDFYQPGEIESVTVGLFETSLAVDPYVGEAIADWFAMALANNGTYPYVFAGDVWLDDDGYLIADPASDVVIVGRVLRYDLAVNEQLRFVECAPSCLGRPGHHDHPRRRDDRRDRDDRDRRDRDDDRRGRNDRDRDRDRDRNDRNRRDRDRDDRDRHDGRNGWRDNRRPYGYSYVHVTASAHVAVTAAMVDPKTGKILHETPGAISRRVVREGDRAAIDPNAALNIAADQVVGELISQFAVTAKTVTVRVSKALRIVAGRNEKGEWQNEDEFTAADTHMTVVIALPREAHRNTFDVVIVAKDTDIPLASRTFTWNRNAPAGEMTLNFNPAAIAAAAGPGKYELHFYANGKDAMSRDFKIVDLE